MRIELFFLAIQLAAAPLLPPLEQPALVELGAPPCCPVNLHVQYWHTMDVPTDAGVFPVQVFAPRLVAQVASEPGAVVATPEPGMGWLALVAMMAMVSCLLARVMPLRAWWLLCRVLLRTLRLKKQLEKEIAMEQKETARKAMEE